MWFIWDQQLPQFSFFLYSFFVSYIYAEWLIFSVCDKYNKYILFFLLELGCE